MEFPDTKATKDAIRDVIGLTATFIIGGDYTPCPVCSGLGYYDAVNEASLDSWCPNCSGEYWIVNNISSDIVAHVRWLTGDRSDYGIAGEVLTGDCIVTINVDDILESHINKIKEIHVDSKKLEPRKHIYRGVPTRDRIRFICIQTGEE